MQFTVVYPNTKESRDAIFGKLIEWSKRIDLENKGINANHFRIVKDYPPEEVLRTFPLNLQVEEVRIEGDKIITLRKLVVDAVELIPEIQAVSEDEEKETKLIPENV